MKNELIFGAESWQKFYRSLTDRKRVFISVVLDDNTEVYLSDYSLWKELKAYCKKQSVYIKKVCLSFRSNKIVEDIPENSDGVYCVKSLIGSIGGTTKHCIVIGILQGDNVAKKSWTTPELLPRNVSPSLEKDCFPEGMIHNVKKSKVIQ